MSDLDDMFVACWFCGCLGDVAGVVQSFEGPKVVMVDWRERSATHEHAVKPPTAEQLEQAGHEALMKIYSETLPRRSVASLVRY